MKRSFLFRILTLFIILSKKVKLARSADFIEYGNNLTGVELDTKNDKNTDSCSFTKGATSDFKSFSAKTGFGFNKVKSSSKVVWETSDSKKFAVTVQVESDSVKLTLADNSTKKFELKSDGCCSSKWVEEGQQTSINT